MKFTNSSLKLLTAVSLSLVIAGCATKQERDASLPSWIDIYDRYDEDGKPKKEQAEEAEQETEEDYTPESSADASDRLATPDEETVATSEETEQATTEEKPKSLFERFFGKKKEEVEQEAAIQSEVAEQAEETDKAAQQLEPGVDDAKNTEATSSAGVADQQTPQADPTQLAEPPKPVIPTPKPLTAQNEQHALEAQKASSDYQRALEKLKDGELQSALILFQELSNRYPTLSGPIVNRAIILRKQGNLNQAKAILQKAILNKTQNPYLMNELGLVNRELGNFEAAKQSYLSAIRLEPNYDKAHYNLGVLADLYLHDPALAFQEFEAYQALQEKPNKKVAGWLKEIKRRIK